MTVRLVERTKACTNPDCPRGPGPQPWSHFNARKRWDDGTPREIYARCKICRSEESRLYRETKAAEMTDEQREARNAAKRARYAQQREDPEYMASRREYGAANMRRYRQRPDYRERWLEGNRRWYRAMMADPDRHAAHLAQRRAQRAANDPEAGRFLLPIEPFKDWLGRELRALTEVFEYTDERHAVTLLAARGDTDSRRVYAWRNENKNIALDVLDAFACNYGEPRLLADLYPDLYDEPVAA